MQYFNMQYCNTSICNIVICMFLIFASPWGELRRVQWWWQWGQVEHTRRTRKNWKTWKRKRFFTDFFAFQNQERKPEKRRFLNRILCVSNFFIQYPVCFPILRCQIHRNPRCQIHRNPNWAKKNFLTGDCVGGKKLVLDEVPLDKLTSLCSWRYNRWLEG